MASKTRRPDGGTAAGGISRRAFLGGAAAVGAGAFASAGVLSRLARAASSAAEIPPRHYIFCYFGGGWDILLGLDPRDPSVFTQGNALTTRIQPAYELTTATDRPVIDPLGDGSMRLGPFMGELAAYADRLCVVRGINMDTLTHEVGRRRFLTGRPPSGLTARGSSTDTWLTGRLGGHAPIPNLSLGVETYNAGDLPNYASALSARGMDDLMRVLGKSDGALSPAVEARIDALLGRAAACPDGARSGTWARAEDSRLKASEMVSQRLDAHFDLRANTPAMLALREHYGITSTAQLNTGRARAALAATAIMRGVSRVVSFAPVTNLDTHFDNWQSDHGPNLAEGHTAVARLIAHLESVEYPDIPGTSWLDHTVVVGFSEFSRTPLINTQGGRDHWLLNACFLAGGNIARGKVIGASSNLAMNPLPTDLRTGAPCALDAAMTRACDEIPGVSEVVRPEHILQALYHEVGLTRDEADLRAPPLHAIFRS